MQRKLSPTFIRLLVICALTALLFAARKIFHLENLFTAEYLHQWFEKNFWLGSVIFICLFTLGNLVQIPGFIFLAIALAIIGKLYSGLLIVVSALISSAVVFLLIDKLGHNMLSEIRYKWVNDLLKRLKERP